jgi:ferric-dicitrate binding protein FerR (iron transport regulator)
MYKTKRMNIDKEIEWLTNRMDEDFALLNEENLLPESCVPDEKILTGIRTRISARRLRLIIFRAAAVLIPVAFLAYAYIYINNRTPIFDDGETAEIVVPRGEHLQFLFQDGTHAYLEPETTIRYPKRFNLKERKITLEGAGYFVIEANKNRPFIIEVNGGQVQVLGTNFELYARPDERIIRLALDSGDVNFKAQTQKEHAIKPGQVMLYDKYDDKYTVLDNEAPASLTLWKNNILSFNDTPLAETLKKLERWYDVHFETPDTAANILSFTLDINGSLDECLTQMSKIAPITFKYKGKKNIEIVYEPVK